MKLLIIQKSFFAMSDDVNTFLKAKIYINISIGTPLFERAVTNLRFC